MKSVIVDTNVFLRFFLSDIPQQKKACEQLLKKAKHNEITLKVSQIVLFEIDYTLRKYYQFEKEVVIKHLKPLVATAYIDIESREIFQKALLLYEKEHISFVDSFLLAKAELEDAELFTFDKKLEKLK